MDNDNDDEFYEGGGEENHGLEDLNKVARLQKYNNLIIETSKNEKIIEPSETYNTLQKIYDKSTSPDYIPPLNFSPPSSKSSESTEEEDKNPINKFIKMRKELELIEKDLNYYSEHKEEYKQKFNTPLEQCQSEFSRIKSLTEYINSTENFNKLQKIFDTQKKSGTNFPMKKLNLLNKKLYNNLENELNTRLKNMKKIKNENIPQVDVNKNVEYELFVTPETQKVKEFTRIIEIQHTIQNIEKKIGLWDYETKKKSLASVVINVRNNIRLFDRNFMEEIKKKINSLNERITELEENTNFYKNEVDKNIINDLFNNFSDSKDVEDTIYNSIYKMESLKNEHEQSAYISLKVKELIEQQEKINNQLNNDYKLLELLKNNVQNNVEMMKKNIELLEKRLK